MALDLATATNGVNHFFAVRIGESMVFDLNINLSDTDEDMERDPLRDRYECMFVDIRDRGADGREKSMKNVITSPSHAGKK